MITATTTTAATVVLLGIIPYSFYGWGRLIESWTKYRSPFFALTIGIGLAAIISIGGILNLTRIAFPFTLWAILVLGCVITYRAIPYRKRSPADILSLRKYCVGKLALVGAVAAMILFTLWTQLAPDLFNIYDDFQKYFGHPVRMLETGTVFGSPLSAIGSESIGGQPFLQGIVLSFFPISYINSFDAVFCFALCLALVAVPTLIGREGGVFSALAAISVAAINPHYANISSLYSGAALVACALFVGSTDVLSDDPYPRFANPAVLGLLYSGMVALKPTFVVFPVSYTIFLSATYLLSGRSSGETAIWGTHVVLASLGFFSPWLILHWPHWVTGFHGPTLPPIPESEFRFNAPPLFSSAESRYGSSFLDYTVAFAGASAVAICSYFFVRPPVRQKASSVIAGALSLLSCYIAILYFAGKDSNKLGALRYSIPYALAGVPAIYALAGVLCSCDSQVGFRKSGRFVLIMIAIGTVAPSLPAARTRIIRAIECHTALSFASVGNIEYQSYSDFVLRGGRQNQIEQIQSLIPRGSTAVVWINTPFYLNFARNTFYEIDIAGLRTPWARIPDCEYMIWEYRGYGVRTPQDYARDIKTSATRADAQVLMRGLQFYHFSDVWSQAGQILYNDGKILIARLPTRNGTN